MEELKTASLNADGSKEITKNNDDKRTSADKLVAAGITNLENSFKNEAIALVMRELQCTREEASKIVSDSLETTKESHEITKGQENTKEQENEIDTK